MIDPDRGPLALLDDAASALLAAGCADPFVTTAAMRLRCLWAGGRLQAIGARPERPQASARADELAGVIVIALVGLTLLDDETSSADIADTRAALTAALAELG